MFVSYEDKLLGSGPFLSRMTSPSSYFDHISRDPISKDGHTQRFWAAEHLEGMLSHPLDTGSEDIFDVSTLVPGSDGDSS